jgi:aryl-alcohol dehydrogenase-like predicted oxidoreductase
MALGRATFASPFLNAQQPQLHRVIPATGERIPAVGLGTHTSFSSTARILDRHGDLLEVLRRFAGLGGRVIDTPPPYRDSERVLANLTEAIDVRDAMFWATKVAIRASGGRDAGLMQVEQTLERLGHIDLSQVFDLFRWHVQLPLLQELKRRGRIRYVGITTSHDEQHRDLAEILRTEALDFVQLDYAIDNRNAETELFPIARDRGLGVLVNSPFGRGRLFRRVGDRPVPEWARDFGAGTWSQFFLKWALADEAVTAVIASTSNPHHLEENMGAGRGRLPTGEERERMARFVAELPEA